ncbi:hypothetical protein CBL_05412 [Carabus blaptoides fortunei]
MGDWLARLPGRSLKGSKHIKRIVAKSAFTSSQSIRLEQGVVNSRKTIQSVGTDPSSSDAFIRLHCAWRRDTPAHGHGTARQSFRRDTFASHTFLGSAGIGNNGRHIAGIEWGIRAWRLNELFGQNFIDNDLIKTTVLARKSSDSDSGRRCRRGQTETTVLRELTSWHRLPEVTHGNRLHADIKPAPANFNKNIGQHLSKDAGIQIAILYLTMGSKRAEVESRTSKPPNHRHRVAESIRNYSKQHPTRTSSHPPTLRSTVGSSLVRPSVPLTEAHYCACLCPRLLAHLQSEVVGVQLGSRVLGQPKSHELLAHN